MSCKSRIFQACFLAGESLPFEIDWTPEFSIRWNANSAFEEASRVRPSKAELLTGYEYESSGGQSGPNEPQWPSSPGDTVQDGSILWTARSLSNASLRERIGTAVWTPPTNFTIDNEIEIDEPGRQLTSAQIASDVETVNRKDIRCEVMTTEGNVYVGLLKMKVE